MRWKNKLNKREVKHIDHFGVKTIKGFMSLRRQALSLNKVFPWTTACPICMSIAKKLGIMEWEDK